MCSGVAVTFTCSLLNLNYCAKVYGSLNFRSSFFNRRERKESTPGKGSVVECVPVSLMSEMCVLKWPSRLLVSYCAKVYGELNFRPSFFNRRERKKSTPGEGR